MMVPPLNEPQHNQAVEPHGGGRSALGGLVRPALGLLKAQVLLGVVEAHLNRPARCIPGEHLLGWGNICRATRYESYQTVYTGNIE